MGAGTWKNIGAPPTFISLFLLSLFYSPNENGKDGVTHSLAFPILARTKNGNVVVVLLVFGFFGRFTFSKNLPDAGFFWKRESRKGGKIMQRFLSRRKLMAPTCPP